MTEVPITAGASCWRADQESGSFSSVLSKIEHTLSIAEEQKVRIIVFPALIGTCFRPDEFLEAIRQLSNKYSHMYICPGSIWEEHEGQRYHASCIIHNNRILLWQRQLYLARWEKEHHLSRGTEVSIVNIEGYRTCIILSTDVFYPQVSRYAALSGVDLVLSPVAIKTTAAARPYFQLRGVWPNVQSNLFFSIESGFKGKVHTVDFFSHSAIHAPLAMTDREDGFLAIEEGFHHPDHKADQSLVSSPLDRNLRRSVLEHTFNPLRQLNPGAYSALFGEE